MDQARDDVVNAGSVALAIREYGGRGRPVVLLHGGTRNLGDWSSIARVMTRSHRVVALDLRSHGASTPCGATWDVDDAVADVHAVVAALDLDTPWLVGHSIGGIIATRYAAAQRPCRGVVNIDGVGVSLPPIMPGPDPVGTRAQLQALIAQMAAALDPATAAPPRVLSAPELRQHVQTQRIQAVQRGADWAVLGPTAERAWFPRADGAYEENPSPVAVAALSQAVLDIDIFALTRAVPCPLLFIEAIAPAAPIHDRSGSGAVNLMQAWRNGVQLAFEHIASEHPQVTWRGLVGDHMLVPHQAAPLTNLVLDFMQATASAEPANAR